MATGTDPGTAVGGFTSEIFAASVASAAPAAPSWWLERKEAAFRRFSEQPLPKRGDESWRFSNIAGVKLDGYSLPPAVDPRLKLADGGFGEPASLKFANNRPVGSRPSRPDLEGRGIVVSTFAEALRNHSDLLRAHFMAQPQKLGSEAFAALHTAFVQDGAFIYVPRGVELSRPIVVVHAAAGTGAAVFPHTLVIAEENSQVTVIDLFTSAGENNEAQFICGANDLYAGHGSRLTYVGVQDWSQQALSFQLNSTVVRRDARVQSLNVHLGGRQARHESLSQLQAPGAFSEMLSLTLAGGTQEFDQRTLQVHQAPNTKSDLLYKNVLRDSAKTIFSGLIVVDSDAQKTDAYQSNRNLVLSDSAEANSLPGLEIQANDVRCTHGATTSRIDPEQLFYLQARGITLPLAHELLVTGFFEEALNRLENPGIHSALSNLINSKVTT